MGTGPWYRNGSAIASHGALGLYPDFLLSKKKHVSPPSAQKIGPVPVLRVLYGSLFRTQPPNLQSQQERGSEARVSAGHGRSRGGGTPSQSAQVASRYPGPSTTLPDPAAMLTTRSAGRAAVGLAAAIMIALRLISPLAPQAKLSRCYHQTTNSAHACMHAYIET
ncbi:hypothetical protein GQ53DRAFT_751052 [Thozetella sp. PMI_491]|nr:hypothetical protein GQ53DRAFT_751052 [Thozetella sp. PMI_491]